MIRQEKQPAHPGKHVNVLVKRVVVAGVQAEGARSVMGKQEREKGRAWLTVTRADGRRLHG